MAAFLLDTAVFLWLALDPNKLSSPTRATCADARNRLLLSAVSVWEMELKYRLGKLVLDLPPPQFVRTYRQAHLVDALPFNEAQPCGTATCRTSTATPSTGCSSAKLWRAG